MDDLLRLLLLQDANTRVVLLGTALLGMCSGVIGSFAVLRGRALVGDALAHAALPGICVAWFVVRDRSLPVFLLGALVFGILGIVCISFVRAQTRIKEDAAIGVVLAGFFGLGIALSRIIQNEPGGNRAGLDSYIFGRTAAMVRQDVWLIAAVAAVVLTVVALLYKEFRALCFDRQFAAAQGWPVLRLDILLMALLCLCTVIGLPAVGVVLMAALLIIPAAAARFWTERLGAMLLIAGLVGLLSCVAGASASALAAKLPAGPLIVLAAGACFGISMLLAPRRGVLAGVLRRRRIRATYAMQNVLRALYECGETAGDRCGLVSVERLLPLRAWPEPTLRRQLARAASLGFVRREGSLFGLTSRGITEAVNVVRAHRLWETFLLAQPGAAPEHVHRDADEIEHILPPHLIAELEARLPAESRPPDVPPTSPHALGEGAP